MSAGGYRFSQASSTALLTPGLAGAGTRLVRPCKGSEPAGAMKEHQNSVYYLLKICLGWTLELLTLNLSLY